MSIGRLILREILHRKLNFAFALTSMLVAVGCLVGMLTVLEGYDLHTVDLMSSYERQLLDQQEVVQASAKKLKDDYRKITKGLGFNILILPKDQDLSTVYTDGYAAKTMPEEYVTRLAASEAMTVDHLLPTLEKQLEWPEHKRKIFLIGTRGEVPFVNRKQKKPLLDPVAAGEVVLGYELARSLELAKGDQTELFGRSFTVANTYSQRGNKDDATAWISLGAAQEIFLENKLIESKDRINAIWALECNCETIERLSQIREEIAVILPDTQIIETVSTAVARAEARNRAVEEAKAALIREQESFDNFKNSRDGFRNQLESMAALASPM
ncbi:MAG: hypothetical protein N2C14_21360, partial [Planctomycetales bacterium]